MARPRLDLYEEAQPDHEARVLEHLGLVKRIALHLKVRVPSYVEVDELVQAGMLGLMEAAKSYDPSKGVSFENFAHIRVRGAMIDEVRRMSYLPRSAVATNKTLAKSVHELSTKIGRQPTQAEIARHLEIESPSLVRLLDRLEADGWIERQHCPGDRRARRIHLTGRAKAVCDEIEATVIDVRRQLLGSVSPAEVAQCVDVLRRINAAAAQLAAGEPGGTPAKTP